MAFEKFERNRSRSNDMTVQELIRKLQAFNPDSKVVVYGSAEDNGNGWIMIGHDEIYIKANE